MRVQACGICLSDVHLIDGTCPDGRRPPVRDLRQLRAVDDVAHGVQRLASKDGDPIRLIVAP